MEARQRVMLVKAVAHSPAEAGRNNLCRAVGRQGNAGASGMLCAGLARAVDFSLLTGLSLFRTVAQTHLLTLSPGETRALTGSLACSQRWKSGTSIL